MEQCLTRPRTTTTGLWMAHSMRSQWVEDPKPNHPPWVTGQERDKDFNHKDTGPQTAEDTRTRDKPMPARPEEVLCNGCPIPTTMDNEGQRWRRKRQRGPGEPRKEERSQGRLITDNPVKGNPPGDCIVPL